MSLDDAFFVNIPAFKRATKRLSPEQVGLLMTLLAYRHERGALPDDPVKMLAIPGFDEQEWQRCWPGLSRFFEPHGTPWLRSPEEMEDGDYE